MNSSPFRLTLLALLLILFAQTTAAHETRYIQIQLDLADAKQNLLSVELDLLDLELVLGLDSDGDGAILWYEYEDKRAEVEGYIRDSLLLTSAGQPCTLRSLRERGGIRATKNPTLVTVFELNCADEIENLGLDNRLLSGIDRSANTLIRLKGSGAEKSQVLQPGISEVNILETGFVAANVSFIRQGIIHILIGYDHLVFLLLLILPAARRGTTRQGLLSVAAIVTAFTLAHSVTLSLSATGYFSLPSQPVEIVIAASIVLAGMINLIRPSHQMGWLIAYTFGLIHGFGFAGALSELAIADNLRLANLAAFNIGVELGQVGLLAMILPLLAVLGSPAFYRRFVVRFLSLFATLAGAVWMIQRLA